LVDEVLSQNEIDTLLSAITSGEMDAEELKQEEEENKIKVYDFKRALRFSKDQIRSISRIHENYARLMTTFFSAQLRTHVDISVVSVDQIPYEEFIRSVPSITVLNIYSLAPLEGKILMEVNPNIAYSMLDRVLGGKGSSVKNMKHLTEIESLLIRQLFEKATHNIKEAWSTIVDVEPSLEEFETNPQFLQMVSPNETVVVVSFNITIGEESGMMNICIPHILLEPIIPKLSVHYWMQTNTKKRDEEAFNQLSVHIEDVIIDVRALLGKTTISIQDFLNIHKDDVIALDQGIDDPLILSVNNEPKHLVQPGRQKNKLSVQILEEIEGRSTYDE